MKNARLLVSTLMMSSALMLAACQTTGTTGNGAQDPVNAALERATSEEPTDGGVESLASIERLYKKDNLNPNLAVRYSRALRENGRMTRAAMVLNPLMEAPKTKTAAVITEYAAVQASMGNYEVAEKNARTAVLKDPNSAQAYHVLGISLDAQGFHKQAEVAFRKALDSWSGDPSPVLNNLGLNLAAQGFLDEAISTLRRAASLSPNKQEIERNLRIVQALQVQPGTAAPSSRDSRPEATTAPAPIKPAVEPKKETPATQPAKKPEAKADTTDKKASNPDTEKSGGIVVEDLSANDKPQATTKKPVKPHTND